MVKNSKHICVYLGAKKDVSPMLIKSVIRLGKEIAEKKYVLVYGGSSLGLMGVLAKTVKVHGGQVLGFITQNLLEKEHNIADIDEMFIVNTMQERKKLMQEKGDVFIVMPGGLGTLEEAIETWNAIKVGEIEKPIGFVNEGGFFDKLFDFMDVCVDFGFLDGKIADTPVVDIDSICLLRRLVNSAA